MKRSKFFIIFAILLLAGCSAKSDTGDKGVVVQINNYKMTIDDLRYELKNMPYDEKEAMDTKEGKKEFIDRLLEKEILLQEAQHQGLDREKDFMKSIENYWEQALLKLLLQKKSKEISGLIHVYENEIEEYYRNSGEGLPLSRIKDDIRRAIRQKKETEAMDAWIKELRSKAYIKINDKLLGGVLSNR